MTSPMINNGSEAVRQRTERSEGRWWNHYLSGARSCSNCQSNEEGQTNLRPEFQKNGRSHDQ